MTKDILNSELSSHIGEFVELSRGNKKLQGIFLGVDERNKMIKLKDSIGEEVEFYGQNLQGILSSKIPKSYFCENEEERISIKKSSYARLDYKSVEDFRKKISEFLNVPFKEGIVYITTSMYKCFMKEENYNNFSLSELGNIVSEVNYRVKPRIVRGYKLSLNSDVSVILIEGTVHVCVSGSKISNMDSVKTMVTVFPSEYNQLRSKINMSSSMVICDESTKLFQSKEGILELNLPDQLLNMANLLERNIVLNSDGDITVKVSINDDKYTNYNVDRAEGLVRTPIFDTGKSMVVRLPEVKIPFMGTISRVVFFNPDHDYRTEIARKALEESKQKKAKPSRTISDEEIRAREEKDKRMQNSLEEGMYNLEELELSSLAKSNKLPIDNIGEIDKWYKANEELYYKVGFNTSKTPTITVVYAEETYSIKDRYLYTSVYKSILNKSKKVYRNSPSTVVVGRFYDKGRTASVMEGYMNGEKTLDIPKKIEGYDSIGEYYISEIIDDLSTCTFKIGCSHELLLDAVYEFSLQKINDKVKIIPKSLPIGAGKDFIMGMVKSARKNCKDLLKSTSGKYAIYNLNGEDISFDTETPIDTCYTLEDCRKICKKRAGKTFLVVRFTEESISAQYRMVALSNWVNMERLA